MKEKNAKDSDLILEHATGVRSGISECWWCGDKEKQRGGTAMTSDRMGQCLYGERGKETDPSKSKTMHITEGIQRKLPL